MDEATAGTLQIGFTDEEPRELRVTIGPGMLKITPGAGEPWVQGSYNQIMGALGPKFEVNGGAAHISQKGGTFRLLKGAPDLELELGTAKPYSLAIDGGANDIKCDLGGLPLTGFSGQFGAGRIRIDALRPNPVEMSALKLSTGATNLIVTNLSNFNASEIAIDGGAASIKVDFGGRLKRDCHARISTGVASLDITLPPGLAAKVSAHTSLGSLSIGDGFITKSGGYWTEAALTGNGPVLTLEASASLGSLKVRIG